MRAIQAGAPSTRERANTPVLAVLLLWAFTSVLMMVAMRGNIGPTGFMDADDALRLQQVRDLLNGQGWFDLHQYRIAPPDGVAMHWTRIVDVPLAVVILLFRPFMGQAQAEIMAIVLVPLLNLAAAMLLAARLAARQFGTLAGVIAAQMVVAAIPASIRMMPLRIDHHAWQIVLALVALNGMASRGPRAGGTLAGLALALSLAISLESLPLAIIFAGVCTLRLLRGQREWLSAFMVSLGLASVALFVLTRGFSDIAEHCDAMSPSHVMALLWCATCCFVFLPRLRHRPPALSLMMLAGVGLGALAIMGTRAPQCVGLDAFAALDPLVKRVWLDSVAEGLPVWRQVLLVSATMVLLPLFGLIACWRLWRNAQDQASRDWWLDMALLLAGATVVGLLVTRASAVSCLFATIPAAWQFRAQVAAWKADPLLLRRLARMVLLVILMVPGVAIGLTVEAVMRQPARPSTAGSCNLPKALPALGRMPATTILAGLDLGPAILVNTPHTVVATAHHRASAAMRDLLVAFLGPDRGARAIMAKRGATMVVICPEDGEAGIYTDLAPDGFMAHLVAGKAPEWLEPVSPGASGGIRMWKVRQPVAPDTAR
ncbi:MAG: hypothetical protein IT551_00905 [Novosphingobium sp.]|nr:hypothetical protein [Novosphingobium sp.]